MSLLLEIVHNPAVPRDGRAVTRQAVRAIIPQDDLLLLIHCRKSGDYKFPGGGVRSGEPHRTALLREIREETGMEGVEVLRPFGKVIELDLPEEVGYDLFRMTSTYYWCKPGARSVAQELEAYEQDLEFTPAWVDLDTAIHVNAALLRVGAADLPRWVRRELDVLQRLYALGPLP